MYLKYPAFTIYVVKDDPRLTSWLVSVTYMLMILSPLFSRCWETQQVLGDGTTEMVKVCLFAGTCVPHSLTRQIITEYL